MRHFFCRSAITRIIFFVVAFCSLQLYAQSPDPGSPGTYAVTKAEYDLGDLAYKPPSFPYNVEVRGSVHYPTDLSAGPFPVLLFMHGRHSTCYYAPIPYYTELDWPCTGAYTSITSYEGYDYLAEQMASHGYIVISVSANGINARDNSTGDYGMQARAELLQHHLDLWNTFNTLGGDPFDTLFIGKLDLTNVGTMGHSRGGEGVVTQAIFNQSLGSPYGIKAVLALAPVDFFRSVLNNIPLMNIAPYCDGDVSDLQGVHYYDDARYTVADDEAPKHSVLLLGANHNFFNTVWTPGSYIAGTSDDWDDIYGSGTPFCGSSAPGNGRLSAEDQQAAFNAYASAFFRFYIGNETEFAGLLNAEDMIPPVSSMLDSNEVFVSYHAPASLRLDVNRTDAEELETINTLGADAGESGLAAYDICGDDYAEAYCVISGFQDKEPHGGTEYGLGMPQLGIRWDDTTDTYTNEIPVAYEDISHYAFLQFRAAVNFFETPFGEAVNFSVALKDSAGNVSVQQVKDYTNALYFPPGENYYALPKAMFNTIKIPLWKFAGVDLEKLRKVQFVFNTMDAASILITDIALSGRSRFADSSETAEIITTSLTDVSPVAMNVYPNPVKDIVHIDAGEQIAEVRLFTIAGAEMYSEKNIAADHLDISLQYLLPGIYLLQITTEKELRSFKIVKQ